MARSLTVFSFGKQLNLQSDLTCWSLLCFCSRCPGEFFSLRGPGYSRSCTGSSSFCGRYKLDVLPAFCHYIKDTVSVHDRKLCVPHTHMHTSGHFTSTTKVSFHNLSFVASLASGLSQYGVVSHLFTLLASPHLNPDDMLSVLLMLGHCTEASGKTARSSAACVCVFPLHVLITFFTVLLLHVVFYKCVFLPASSGAPVPFGAVWRPAPYHNPTHRRYQWGGPEGCYLHIADLQTGQ